MPDDVRLAAAPAAAPTDAGALARSRRIMAALCGPTDARDFAVRYWDAALEAPTNGLPARFTIVLRHPGALRALLLPPSELRIAEAFVRGEVDVEGDVEAASTLGDRMRARMGGARGLARLVLMAVRLPRTTAAAAAERGAGRRPVGLLGRLAPRHSERRDGRAVRSHYDVGNEFYSLFLDERMVYSCGYWRDGVADVHTAQRDKLDHICRKLRLRPGQRLLDIGCGWGALIIHAARKYGVQALGITLSERQAALARERIAEAGLAGRCRVEIRDYRELPAGEPFDRISSVGMVEHVGGRQLRRYFTQAFRLLRPGGVFLNHGIVASGVAPARSWLLRRLWGEGEFIDRYVFPDGELLPLTRMIGEAEAVGFETRDVETLREHYALTLRQWVRRLEAARDQAVALVGPETYRVWRLYMAASAHRFATGAINIAQTVLARPDSGGRVEVPRTREDLYLARA